MFCALLRMQCTNSNLLVCGVLWCSLIFKVSSVFFPLSFVSTLELEIFASSSWFLHSAWWAASLDNHMFFSSVIPTAFSCWPSITVWWNLLIGFILQMMQFAESQVHCHFPLLSRRDWSSQSISTSRLIFPSLWNKKKCEERKKLSNSVWRHNLDSFQCSLRESSIKTPFKIILAVGLQFTCSSMQRWDHVQP